ncbi:unnamed protein product, partial [Tetraodon nigroviridis]
AEPGLVPTHAGHFAGQQRRRRGAERFQKLAGESGFHLEIGFQPFGPSDRFEGTYDGTEKAEAAHRFAGTPSAHEHQPSAARLRPSRRRGCTATAAPSCATVGTRCNIAEHT